MQKTSFTPKELNDGFVVAINIEAKDNEGEAVAAILERDCFRLKHIRRC